MELGTNLKGTLEILEVHLRKILEGTEKITLGGR